MTTFILVTLSVLKVDRWFEIANELGSGVNNSIKIKYVIIQIKL